MCLSPCISMSDMELPGWDCKYWHELELMSLSGPILIGSTPEVRVHNELFVLGGAKLWVPHHEQELMVQVVKAGTPRTAAQGGTDCELVADSCQLGRQHDGIWLPVLAHNGGQERPHIPQQLRKQSLT